MKRAFACLGLSLVPFALGGCPKEGELTAAEAQESLQQASASSQAENLAAASVDISTHFTIGGAVEQAASELKAFLASQLPCADVTLARATLTIEYGVNAGNCVVAPDPAPAIARSPRSPAASRRAFGRTAVAPGKGIAEPGELASTACKCVGPIRSRKRARTR